MVLHRLKSKASKNKIMVKKELVESDMSQTNNPLYVIFEIISESESKYIVNTGIGL